ncbi:HPr(Ser) kinase/phosphatase [Persicirhabdus sediminis]|uniref:HPr kinase/phosphorylase n=1 Tax=Persicirhabdus sediminis TaxID=454144 RepID=A0A8J7MF69_9BACT|nr:HPr(Ser) kinase/phosphatase [Persicirhabdus sediminis]MBK1791602.1 HPr(Ser) kinase/phosphatase [Persicirhabdus sediminis]
MAKKEPKRKKVTHITVGDFFNRHKKALELTLQGQSVGMDRKILEPNINHPGLALSGFLTYFAEKRIQVLGNSELSYMKTLTESEKASRFEAILKENIPCIVTARAKPLPTKLLELANSYGVPVFMTPKITMNFVNAATIRLEEDFAESVSLHGCMMDFKGVGVLIMGDSGSGKSETALGLLERGAALVADDLVTIHNISGELIASTKEFSRGFIEMRGIGIINAANLFGLGSISPKKDLDIVIQLKPHSHLNEVDRLGINRQTYNILDVEVSKVEIPVAPGRDTARLVAVTCLDHQLRTLGYDMADEFNQRLLDRMAAGNVSL